MGEQQAHVLGRHLAGHQLFAWFSEPAHPGRVIPSAVRLRRRCRSVRRSARVGHGIYEGGPRPRCTAEQPAGLSGHTSIHRGETVEQWASAPGGSSARAEAVDGDVALFAHAHVRSFSPRACIELSADPRPEPDLATASLSRLGHERETRVIEVWTRTGG